MKVLWLPLFYMSIPWLLALLLVKWQAVRARTWLKWITLVLLTVLTLCLGGLSFLTSINGMSATGLKCFTGAIIFPPIGIACIAWYCATVFENKT